MESGTCDLGRSGVFGQPQRTGDLYTAHVQLPRTGLLAVIENFSCPVSVNQALGSSPKLLPDSSLDGF